MSGYEFPKVNMFNQMPVQRTAPVSPRQTQAAGGKNPASSIGRNPIINTDDMRNFMASIGNANPNHPAVLNNDPAAGVVRTFDLTA